MNEAAMSSALNKQEDDEDRMAVTATDGASEDNNSFFLPCGILDGYDDDDDPVPPPAVSGAAAGLTQTPSYCGSGSASAQVAIMHPPRRAIQQPLPPPPPPGFAPTGSGGNIRLSSPPAAPVQQQIVVGGAPLYHHHSIGSPPDRCYGPAGPAVHPPPPLDLLRRPGGGGGGRGVSTQPQPPQQPVAAIGSERHRIPGPPPHQAPPPVTSIHGGSSSPSLFINGGGGPTSSPSSEPSMGTYERDVSSTASRGGGRGGPTLTSPPVIEWQRDGTNVPMKRRDGISTTRNTGEGSGRNRVVATGKGTDTARDASTGSTSPALHTPPGLSGPTGGGTHVQPQRRGLGKKQQVAPEERTKKKPPLQHRPHKVSHKPMPQSPSSPGRKVGKAGGHRASAPRQVSPTRPQRKQVLALDGPWTAPTSPAPASATDRKQHSMTTEPTHAASVSPDRSPPPKRRAAERRKRRRQQARASKQEVAIKDLAAEPLSQSKQAAVVSVGGAHQVAGQRSCEGPKWSSQLKPDASDHLVTGNPEAEDAQLRTLKARPRVVRKKDTVCKKERVKEEAASSLPTHRRKEETDVTPKPEPELEEASVDDRKGHSPPLRQRTASMNTADDAGGNASPPTQNRNRSMSESSLVITHKPSSRHKGSGSRRRVKGRSVGGTAKVGNASAAAHAEVDSTKQASGRTNAKGSDSSRRTVGVLSGLKSSIRVPAWCVRLTEINYCSIAAKSCLRLATVTWLVSKVVLNLILRASMAAMYTTVLIHKLALQEVMQNQVGLFCYLFASSYSSVIAFAGEYWIFPHWVPQFVWLCIVTLFCSRPACAGGDHKHVARKVQMEKREQEAALLLKRIAKGGKDGARARKEAARLSLEVHPSDFYEDRSCHTASATLSNTGVFRLLIVLLYLAESLTSTGQGFIMGISGVEQVLLGFMIAVVKMRYVFSPIIWISWSIQVLIISFWQSNFVLEHVLLVMGLASLNLVACVAVRSNLVDVGAGRNQRI